MAAIHSKSYYLYAMILSDQDINIIKDFFAAKPVSKAYLFGSYSRREASDDSDVDLLVELDYSQHIGLSFFSMKDELEERLNKKVDLVPSDGVSKYILLFINKDKKLIYERENR